MPRTKKIMVVDDEPNIRNLLSDVLSEKGYKVTLAKDGQDSLDQLRRRRFDLLITDIEMPRLDGIGLINKMKRRGRKEKIIMMTGKSCGQISLRKKIPSAVPLLFKPFQLKNFLEIVSTTSGISGLTSLHPKQVFLAQNFPNPFNNLTNIQFALPVQTRARLSVFNLQGQEVAVIFDEFKSSGHYSVSLDAENLASGIYMITLQTERKRLTRKFILIK